MLPLNGTLKTKIENAVATNLCKATNTIENWKTTQTILKHEAKTLKHCTVMR